MLVSKRKKSRGKGFSKQYDEPKTPFQRVLDDPEVDEETKNRLRKRKSEINGIELFHRLTKRLRRIRARQDAFRAKSNNPEKECLDAIRRDSALRAAPSGTSDSPCFSSGEIDLAIGESVRKQRCRSVEYLTNQKSQRQHQGVISI